MIKRLSLLFLLVLLVASTIVPVAFAESDYTSVLDDLQQDESFDVADYPKKNGDYSLQVIQIAESVDDELFVYVYQPNGKTVATTINMAQVKEPDTADTHNLRLRLLNSSGTLFKYKVEGLTLRNTIVRYYEISSIFRDWIKGVDEETGNDNVIGEVAFEVGQLWTLEDTDDGVKCSMRGVETIDILNPYVGYVEYAQGWALSFQHDVWCHYVAFDTDKRMDDLLEASVYYEYRPATHNLWTVYGDTVATQKLITKDDVVVSDRGTIKLFGEDYEFSRITKTSDFMGNEHLTDVVKEQLRKTEWVLRFTETSVSYSGSSVIWIDISNVTILRLKFETDGVVYNMGTVMNKISSPLFKWEKEIPMWVWIVVAIVILAVVALIVKPVATLLVWIVKLVVAIVAAPVKFVIWLCKGDKE